MAVYRQYCFTLSACNTEDLGLIPGSGRSTGEGHRIHSSILAWEIQWTEEPGGLQSIGLHRVGHDWTTKTQHTYLLCSRSKKGVQFSFPFLIALLAKQMLYFSPFLDIYIWISKELMLGNTCVLTHWSMPFFKGKTLYLKSFRYKIQWSL